MINLIQKQKAEILFWLSLVAATIAILTAFIIIGFQIYVRWKLNQTFTFLGGNVLEVLLIAGFGMLLGLLYAHRPRQ